MEKKLLIIDEQPDRGSALESHLRQLGIVERCSDGLRGLVSALQLKPDVILASALAPKLAGVELCEQIRASSQAVVLILSSGPSEDRLAYYEAGADEVVASDISAMEIACKAAVWLRRSALLQPKETDDGGQLQFGPLVMNQRTRRTFVGGEEINLTRKEFAILGMLVSKQQQVVTRDELLRIVWSYESLGDDRMIDTHLNRIRKKLSTYNELFSIKTVWGIGYKLEKAKSGCKPGIHTI